MNQKELLLIAASIFITIIAWMMVDIYKIKSVGTIEASSVKAGIVNLNVDAKILEKLKSKQP